MKVLTCDDTGEKIYLEKQLSRGGEGEVWYTNRSSYLAKIYHTHNNERTKKLEAMIIEPPTDPNLRRDHISFAWPTSILRDSSGSCVGFLMPLIKNSKDLLDVYNPKRRTKLGLNVNWKFLHTVAMNVALITKELHSKGYVLGDMKPQNFLVNDRALVSVIDTDSFQVRHPQTGKLHHCLVGTEGFMPPELIGKSLATVEQTEVQDRFRLAVIIYHLLFSAQPFQGQWIGKEEEPSLSELVYKGFWPFSPNSLIQPSFLTIPIDTVHPKIQQCFLKCFNDGHENPQLRPTAQEWQEALEVAIRELVICTKVESHYYSLSYRSCYWCERKSQFGVDVFEYIHSQQFIDIKEAQTDLDMKASSGSSNSRFFGEDNIRYAHTRETLEFYRKHLAKEYNSLSNQANTTYWMWIGCVAFGAIILFSGLILTFLGMLAQGSIVSASTTILFFIQRTFHQREDYYRRLASIKNQHLEYLDFGQI